MMRLRYSVLVLLLSLWGTFVSAGDLTEACVFTSQWPMGMSEHTLVSEGQTRRYLVYLPELYSTAFDMPLVLSFHGFNSTPEQNVTWSHFEQIAEEQGFIAVFPAGEGQPATWNIGSNFISNEASDDLIFISQLMDHVQEQLCVDAEQVYAVGFSAGAGMVARLACHMPNRLAAIGTVAGAFNDLPQNCAQRAVPTMMFHGDADLVVPYTGRWGLADAQSWAAAWAGHNGCAATPLSLIRQDDIEPLVFEGCDENANVVFYTVRGGGHTWPGGETSLLAGRTTYTMDAGEEFWRFFQQYRRTPEAAPVLIASANRPRAQRVMRFPDTRRQIGP